MPAFADYHCRQIHNACRAPVPLDMLQAAAVSARMDLDLRIGAALTRSQTLTLQRRVNGLDNMIISYGWTLSLSSCCHSDSVQVHASFQR